MGMALVENYLRPPGHCRICTSSVTPVIDCGIPYDSDGFGGVFYICANCAAEQAQILGWIPPERWREIAELNEDLLARLDRTEIQTEKLNRQIDAMVRAEDARLRRPRQRAPLP